MTRPSNVIYLPPGVVPPPTAMQPASGSGTPGIPFDRQFFQEILGGAVKAFCEQAGCASPIVELFTIDGARHFVRGISGVSDSWVALHTQAEDHEQPMQVFLPFTTIYRVEIHPDDDSRNRRLGFVPPEPGEPIVISAQSTQVPESAESVDSDEPAEDKPAASRKTPGARRSRKST